MVFTFVMAFKEMTDKAVLYFFKAFKINFSEIWFLGFSIFEFLLDGKKIIFVFADFKMILVWIHNPLDQMRWKQRMLFLTILFNLGYLLSGSVTFYVALMSTSFYRQTYFF